MPAREASRGNNFRQKRRTVSIVDAEIEVREPIKRQPEGRHTGLEKLKPIFTPALLR